MNKRFTHKITHNYITPSNVENIEQLCLNKLGQLEDIEEELGIDLITLFKALFNGVYAKRYLDIVFVEKPYLRTDDKYKPYAIDFCHSDFTHYLKDYGKTWALTREELE
jgi:hypothetical protein